MMRRIDLDPPLKRPGSAPAGSPGVGGGTSGFFRGLFSAGCRIEVGSGVAQDASFLSTARGGAPAHVAGHDVLVLALGDRTVALELSGPMADASTAGGDEGSPVLSPPVLWTLPGVGGLSVAISPAGDLVACGGGGTEGLHLVDLATGQLQRTLLAPECSGLSRVVWSSDGAFVAAATTQSPFMILVWDLASDLDTPAADK